MDVPELGWAKWEAFSLVVWMEEICGMIQYWGVSEYQLRSPPKVRQVYKETDSAGGATA